MTRFLTRFTPVFVMLAILVSMLLGQGEDGALIDVWATESFVLLVGIAVVLPYLCFVGLNALMTPPTITKDEPDEATSDTVPEQMPAWRDRQAQDHAMQYRGVHYAPDKPTKDASSESKALPTAPPKAVMKYRGAIIETPTSPEASVAEQPSQTSTLPKSHPKLKYRGVWVDDGDQIS
jgi:hypothetical protein